MQTKHSSPVLYIYTPTNVITIDGEIINANNTSVVLVNYN